jgi:hypothetical protein
MIQLQSAEQLKRARAGKLFVQATAMFRQYRVTNRESGNAYVVDFFVRDGKRFGHCTCKAGVNNQACKHLSAAAALHMMLAAAANQTNTVH